MLSNDSKRAGPLPFFVVMVVGNIATGKTFIVQEAGRCFYWDTHLRTETQKNPWLASSKNRKGIWPFRKKNAPKPFHQQMWFAIDELCEYQNRLDRVRGDVLIVDHYPGVETIEIFSWVLYESGELNDAEWMLFEMFRDIWQRVAPPPNLLIYLYASSTDILQERIRQRDDMQNASLKYLKRFQKEYGAMVEECRSIPHISINTDRINLNDPATLDEVLDTINHSVQILRNSDWGDEIQLSGYPSFPNMANKDW